MLFSDWFHVDKNGVRLLRDGSVAFPAMLKAIEEAQQVILMEMYWFAKDEIGTRVRDSLVTAAKRGVMVRLIYDAFGSIGVPDSFWKPLLTVQPDAVRMFGPLAPWRKRFSLARTWHRNHRKMMVVDEQHCFVGGLNIGNEWWSEDDGNCWRDDVIEVIGPAAEDVRALFWRTWRHLGGEAPKRSSLFYTHPSKRVWLIANDRGLNTRRQIRHAYLSFIRNARSSIDITNAYFLPDYRVYRALIRAHRKGVRVRILLPGKSDIATVSLAQQPLLELLLRRGIDVYLYTKQILHSKTAVIDDFVTVGSYNVDHRSWRFNLECNIAVTHHAFAKAVQASFTEDLSHAQKISLRDMQKLPAHKRLLGVILSKFHFFL